MYVYIVFAEERENLTDKEINREKKLVNGILSGIEKRRRDQAGKRDYCNLFIVDFS